MSENGRPKRPRDTQPQAGEGSPATKKSNNAEDDPKKMTREQLLQALYAARKAMYAANEALQKKARIEKNRSFESLLKVEDGSFRLIRTGVPYSHVDGPHIEAKAKEVEFKLHDPDKKRLESSTGASRLLQDFVDQDHVTTPDLQFIPYSYGGEADICSLIRCACVDAIAILEAEGGLFKKGELSAKLERSLFACRPDIMVVRDTNGIGLLAVEVKQPIPSAGENLVPQTLVEKPKVLGHAFDHAMAMDAFGQGTAIVIITSFSESYLCSLNESDFKEEEEEEGNESDIKERGDGDEITKSKDVRLTQSPPEKKTPMMFTRAPTVSYDGSSSRSSSNNSPPTSSLASESPDDLGLFTKGTNNRLLYRSKSYQPHLLVKLVYSALKVAKKKYKDSTRTIYELSPEKAYVFPKALRVVEDIAGYFWGDLRVKLDQKIVSQSVGRNDPLRKRTATEKTVDDNDEKSYYIIGSLGHGATSNVYQALNSSGKQVALKVYVNNRDNNTGDLMTKASFEKVAKLATKTEADNLRTFYPFLKEEVKVVKLFGLYCVVMPLFEPVAKEKRTDQLPKIKDVLTRTFQQQKKKYKDEDIRWRHVGNYKDNKGGQHCILYDLSDLDGLSDSVNSGSFVAELLKQFSERIPEPQRNNMPLNAKEPDAPNVSP